MRNEVYKKKLDKDGNPVIINGDFVMELVSFEELPDIKLPPNWHDLEQNLRYSTLFEKAFTDSSEKGFNLFTTTLVNGKLGHASENALMFAFNVLGVNWNEKEKQQINSILEANYFTIKI
jgi:hypothetical protein